MEKVNEYSDLASQKETAELLAIMEDDTQHAQYRLAAIWELEKRNEATADVERIKERLKTRWDEIRTERYNRDKYRTFWPRFFASLIDGLIVGFSAFFVSLLFLASDPSDRSIFFWDLFIEFLAYFYFIAMHANSGQTIGKKAMGVKVVRHIDEGSIGWKAAYMRDIVPLGLLVLLAIVYLSSDPYSPEAFAAEGYLDSIGGLWALAEIITMLTNEKRRALHDFVAGTVVIRC